MIYKNIGGVTKNLDAPPPPPLRRRVEHWENNLKGFSNLRGLDSGGRLLPRQSSQMFNPPEIKHRDKLSGLGKRGVP
jgi:hypothetical protein